MKGISDLRFGICDLRRRTLTPALSRSTGRGGFSHVVDEISGDFAKRDLESFGGGGGGAIDWGKNVCRARVEDHFGFVGAGIEAEGVIVEACNVFDDVVEGRELICR